MKLYKVTIQWLNGTDSIFNMKAYSGDEAIATLLDSFSGTMRDHVIGYNASVLE